MLIDIFARRYAEVPLRENFEEYDRRLLIQAFRILKEDIFPYYHEGKEISSNVAIWTKLESGLSREFGQTELSAHWFSYVTKWNGSDQTQTVKHTLVSVCENWLTQPVSGSPDTYIKERLSLIELGFRQRGEFLAVQSASPVSEIETLFAALSQPRRAIPVPNDATKRHRDDENAAFRRSVDELNTRFRQAGYPLNYHNGFIQIATDDLVQVQIETPFWKVVDGPIWRNVDLDMKEALDLRDSGGRDPAFYAARALESAIKIICDRKRWTNGKEKGAHNYIDNLASKANGFITQWESDSLKGFFTHVRNPFGHGAGSAEMPSLTSQQTEWAIEFSMSWTKNLIRRL